MSFSPSREPGAAENPVWRCGVLSLLSRGGETGVVASGSAPRYRGIKGHTAESRVQFGWYRGYITAVPWNAPWGGFFRPTQEAVFISIAHRLNGLFARILRCFPLQSAQDCCGKSPCLRTKILVIRRALLTKTTSIYSSGRIL